MNNAAKMVRVDKRMQTSVRLKAHGCYMLGDGRAMGISCVRARPPKSDARDE